ncbi:hypothetical protein PISMIDRAFT_246809 [Pisolithus microcarpus 441]|uniref:Uncharacterized protein n=1 Tax=Pisolithus microcarpus 441 TaxID=765257 RepID=A0A0C9ZBV7_9AGAM|nr:hypothetical protein PISMIDRAFT_246809 [Pisolithus microcarpus 441]
MRYDRTVFRRSMRYNARTPILRGNIYVFSLQAHDQGRHQAALVLSAVSQKTYRCRYLSVENLNSAVTVCKRELPHALVSLFLRQSTYLGVALTRWSMFDIQRQR